MPSPPRKPGARRGPAFTAWEKTPEEKEEERLRRAEMKRMRASGEAEPPLPGLRQQDRTAATFEEAVARHSEVEGDHIIWTGPRSNGNVGGSPVVSLLVDGKSRNVVVRVRLYREAHDNPTAGGSTSAEQVVSSCGERNCIKTEHLTLVIDRGRRPTLQPAASQMEAGLARCSYCMNPAPVKANGYIKFHKMPVSARDCPGSYKQALVPGKINRPGQHGT